MVLSDEDVAKFQALYKREFGIEISKEDAYEQGIKLLSLLAIVYKPMTQEEHEQVQLHRRDTLLLIKAYINI